METINKLTQGIVKIRDFQEFINKTHTDDLVFLGVNKNNLLADLKILEQNAVEKQAILVKKQREVVPYVPQPWVRHNG